MQNCANCGKQLSPGMTACPRCKQRIPTSEIQITYQSSYPDMVAQAHKHEDPQVQQQSAHSRLRPGITTLTHSDFPASSTPSSDPSAIPSMTIFSKLIIGVTFSMAFLLIISGLGLLYYAEIVHPTQLRLQAEATLEAVQDVDAENMRSARLQATATARGQINEIHAEATAQAQSNAQIQATATALQTLYKQSTSKKPFMQNPLFFESKAGWDIYPTKDGGGCAFTNNAFHSTVFQKGYFAPCIAHKTHVHNFALEIQMTILKGDEGGIIFRSNTRDSNFYSFRIRADGTYALMLTHANDTTSLVSDRSNLIKTGRRKMNILTVIVQGSNIYLYINRHYVGSASDSSYRAGAIGVMAVDRKHDTDVAFNNLRLWRL
ncbi:zinc ribbon domain-containing protein [Dictyobacter arantiisoli]|uniref:3-keto-disaccharide hydrolase domain-containing protein n=1 Tax=Dictyobacter arantiisoli TaxID=2014874 RepID=A0A5A5TAX2_9CHLR|nr:zinc ribbon domain-containing protein [Dictyobacter arantiisoli]GCF08139.1 hypothetical protein KDI_17030 [Dictyobacter arantiisoli]